MNIMDDFTYPYEYDYGPTDDFPDEIPVVDVDDIDTSLGNDFDTDED